MTDFGSIRGRRRSAILDRDDAGEAGDIYEILICPDVTGGFRFRVVR